MKHTLLGLDPSLTSTGFCYEDKEGRMHSGRIRPKSLRGVPRLIYIRNCVDQIIKNGILKHNRFTMVAYEGYSMGSQQTRSYSMGELGGVLQVHILEARIRLLLVPPSSLKKFVTGSGRADKSLMVDKIAEIWQYNIQQHDEADAFGLLQFGKAYTDARVRRTYNSQRREVLNTASLFVPEFENDFKIA